MNRELKDKWVAALRSGKYVQGKNRLKTKDIYGNTRFCCMGVLKEVDGSSEGATNTHHPLYLSGDELQAVGLTTGQQNYLTRQNDELDRTFDEIANQIEGLL